MFCNSFISTHHFSLPSKVSIMLSGPRLDNLTHVRLQTLLRQPHQYVTTNWLLPMPVPHTSITNIFSFSFVLYPSSIKLFELLLPLSTLMSLLFQKRLRVSRWMLESNLRSKALFSQAWQDILLHHWYRENLNHCQSTYSSEWIRSHGSPFPPQFRLFDLDRK